MNPLTLRVAARYAIADFKIIDKAELTEQEQQIVVDIAKHVKNKLTAIGLGKFANGKLTTGYYGNSFAARYISSTDEILLNIDKLLIRGHIPRIMGLGPLYHEVGHRIFLKLPTKWRAWYESEFELAGKKSVSSYGHTNVHEDFAEIFKFVVLDNTIPPDILDRFLTVIKEI